MGGTYGFTATEAEYNNFNLYGNELLNNDALYGQVIGSLQSSGVSKDALQLKFYDLNNLRGTKIRGGDGWTMMGTFSGDIGAAGSVIASVAKGDGNGAAIGAATFLIPVRLPGAKIIGEVGAEIAGAATKQGVLRSEEILKSVQNAGVDAIEVGESAARAGAAGRPADALRLSTQLAYEEAGILTRGGNALTKEAVRSSREIPISGGKLTNPAVVKELTSDGSRIEDWGKFTTQTIVLPSGQRSQIHYYMNKVTGKLNFNIDFKVKGRVE